MNNLILSVDKLNTFSICPRKYFFNFVLNREHEAKPKFFNEGEYLHKCLEYYYRDKMKKRIQGIDFYIEIARNYAADFSEKLSYDELEFLINIFRDYLTYYYTEDWIIEDVEAPFAKELFADEKANLRVIIRGKSDLLIKTINDRHATVDHKCLSRFEEGTVRDNQILAYSWAFDRRDFYLNKLGKQKSYSSDKRFVRDYFCVSQSDIDDWVETTIYDSLSIARMFEKDYFPGRFTGCKFRGFDCPYLNVCSLPRENWEYSLESDFVERVEFDLMKSEDNV